MQDDEELKRLLVKYIKIKEQQCKRRIKKKRTYLLVSIVAVLVMGLGVVTIGELPIAVKVERDGNTTRVSGYHEGDTAIDDYDTREGDLYDKAKEVYGIDIARVMYMPEGTAFKDGSANADTKKCEYSYSVGDKYIKFMVYATAPTGYNATGERITVSGTEIYISNLDGTYTANFTHKGIYYVLTADIPEEEFIKMVESLYMC